MVDKILVIEDDEDIAEMVISYLGNEGYNMTLAKDGEEAIQSFRSGNYQFVILDLLLPKLDGFEVLKEIRKDSLVPVLIMSAKGSDVDKALGLGFGADDYLAKPFSLIELTARVKAGLRRAALYANQKKDTEVLSIKIKDMLLNQESYTVEKGEESIQLTYKEFKILELLALHPKRVYTKAQIYEHVWEESYFGDENVMNVHIRRLREKIEDQPSKPQIVTTVWGIGYRLGAGS